jgi:tetratricopeptide (TPR) repeat protein
MNVRKHLDRLDRFGEELQKATQFATQGGTKEARDICQRLLALEPENAAAHNMMGVVAIAERRRSEALYHFQFAVSKEPNNVGYLHNLGRLFLELERIELAVPVFMRMLRLDPTYSAAVEALSDFFMKIGRADRSLPILENYLSKNPDKVSIQFAYAMALESIGKQDSAGAIYEKLVEVSESRIYSLFRLAQIRKHTAAAPLMDKILDQLQNANLAREQIKLLHGAAGKISEDIGDYDNAFKHYQLAAEHDYAQFKPEVVDYAYDYLISHFTKEFLARKRELGHMSKLPVLVVGMPRSGTTLTEQIIDRHSQADGAGELPRLGAMARSLGYKPKREKLTFFDSLNAMTLDQSRSLSENYLQLLRFYSPKGIRIVDKMPHNYQNVGFFSMLFPLAKIIHCRRDPIDTCLSIYVNRFNDSHAYSNDLTSLGTHYRQYARLMDHWKNLVPDQIYESTYEQLTEVPAAKIPELIRALDLPWEEACLSPNEAKSTVMTLSAWQVRQPVYKTSVKRWKRFEKHLGPLIDALGDRAEAA